MVYLNRRNGTNELEINGVKWEVEAKNICTEHMCDGARRRTLDSAGLSFGEGPGVLGARVLDTNTTTLDGVRAGWLKGDTSCLIRRNYVSLVVSN